MRLTDPSQITTDTIFYIVTVFPDERRFQNSYIHKYKAIEEPHTDHGSWWVKCIPQSFYEDRMIITMKASFEKHKIIDGYYAPLAGIPRMLERSLKDAGVEANIYNDHQTFDCYEDAVQRICSFYNINFKDPLATRDKYKAYERAMGIL